MQVGTSALLSTTLGRSMTDLKATFEDLTRQLSSGQVATTYGGLGSGRGTALAMQSQISTLQGYSATVSNVDLRINTLSTALTRLSDIASEQRSDTDITDNTIVANGQTRAQIDARSNLEEALSVLGMDLAGSHIFGGRATDQDPVATADQILDGDGSQIGLRGVIAERRAADVGTVDLDGTGTDSVGRLTISAASGSGFTIAEDGSHPFGFKLAGGTTGISGATLSGPSGTPASMTVNLASQPNPGDTIKLTLTLPDGTTDTVSLTATSGTPASDGSQFRIGATVEDTLTNLRGAIVGQLGTKSQTTLAAASSMVAANDFFAAGSNTPPKRVAFTPPQTAATATSLRDATSDDTVVWYKGDDDPAVSARQSATATIDNGLTVNYGVRANEAGIAKVISSLAVMAAEVYPAGDANAAARNAAISQRTRDALAPASGEGTITGITTELAGAQRMADAAATRHKTSINTAQDMLGSVEVADDQTVAASLIAVQTRLQATYQTTAMLSKLSLVNFL